MEGEREKEREKQRECGGSNFGCDAVQSVCFKPVRIKSSSVLLLSDWLVRPCALAILA